VGARHDETEDENVPMHATPPVGCEPAFRRIETFVFKFHSERREAALSNLESDEIADLMHPVAEAASDHARPESLGARLRRRRTIRRMSLKTVASAAGVSVGQLSQIERDLSEPSLRSLRAICEALEMPLNWVFDPGGADPGSVVVRASQRRRFALGPSGMRKELLSQDSCTGLQMMRIVMHPGNDTGDAPFAVRGQSRAGHVLSGAMGLEVDGVRHRLRAGDSFSFEGRDSVRFWCEGDAECVIIWAAAPAVY
jgi:transcriptional regulator with XRE-family HTH domain